MPCGYTQARGRGEERRTASSSRSALKTMPVRRHLWRGASWLARLPISAAILRFADVIAMVVGGGRTVWLVSRGKMEDTLHLNLNSAVPWIECRHHTSYGSMALNELPSIPLGEAILNPSLDRLHVVSSEFRSRFHHFSASWNGQLPENFYACRQTQTNRLISLGMVPKSDVRRVVSSTVLSQRRDPIFLWSVTHTSQAISSGHKGWEHQLAVRKGKIHAPSWTLFSCWWRWNRESIHS